MAGGAHRTTWPRMLADWDSCSNLIAASTEKANVTAVNTKAPKSVTTRKISGVVSKFQSIQALYSRSLIFAIPESQMGIWR